MEYKGQLKGFPKEVVEWMMRHQKSQGNKMNHEIFETNITASKEEGGFDWHGDDQSHDYNQVVFCRRVIIEKDFHYFFKEEQKANKIKYEIEKVLQELTKLLDVSSKKEDVKREAIAYNDEEALVNVKDLVIKQYIGKPYLIVSYEKRKDGNSYETPIPLEMCFAIGAINLNKIVEYLK